jgi:hypothetical protein
MIIQRDNWERRRGFLGLVAEELEVLLLVLGHFAFVEEETVLL